jgi:hypothetical protein
MERRRTPESIRYWGDDSGGAQRARIEAHPELLERILRAPGARVVTTSKGIGKDLVAVVSQKGQIVGIKLNPDGSITKVPLSRKEGKLLYQEAQGGRGKDQFIPPNYVEPDPSKFGWDGLPSDKTPEGFGDEFPNAFPLDEKGKPILRAEAPVLPPGKTSGELQVGARLPGEVEKGVLGGFSPGTFGDAETKSKKFHPNDEKNYPELDPETGQVISEVSVPGITLSPTPLRTQADLARFPFHIANEPLSRGVGVTPDMAVFPAGKTPELTVVLTQRRPTAKNPEGFAEYSGKTERTLVNPTSDEIREVLLRSNIQNVVFKVMEGEKAGSLSSEGRAANTWHRAKALMAEVRNPPELRPGAPLKNKPNVGMVGKKLPDSAPRVLPPGVKPPLQSARPAAV